MSKTHDGASSSRITLRALAEEMVETFDCDCVDGKVHGVEPDHEDAGGPHCPCGGDDCWFCAALMALANADEASASPTTSQSSSAQPKEGP